MPSDRYQFAKLDNPPPPSRRARRRNPYYEDPGDVEVRNRIIGYTVGLMLVVACLTGLYLIWKGLITDAMPGSFFYWK